MNQLAHSPGPTRDDLALNKRKPLCERAQQKESHGTGHPAPNPDAGKPATLADLPQNTHARATVFASAPASYLSLGAATADKWGKNDAIQGAFRGITLGTEDHAWMTSSGMFLGAIGKGGGVTTKKMAEVHHASHKAAGIASVVRAAIDVADAILHPERVPLTVLEAAHVVVEAGPEAEALIRNEHGFPDGLLHLHAAKNLLLTSDNIVNSAKAVSQLGLVTASMAGGLTAQVRGGALAEVKALGTAALNGIAKAEVTSDFGTHIASRHGEVAVVGDTVEIGTLEPEGYWAGKQQVTRSILAQSKHFVGALVAGDEIPDAELSLDDHGNVVALAQKRLFMESLETCLRGGLRGTMLLNDDGIFLGMPPSSSHMRTERASARNASARAMKAAEEKLRLGRAAAVAVTVAAGATAASRVHATSAERDDWQTAGLGVAAALGTYHATSTAEYAAHVAQTHAAEKALLEELAQITKRNIAAVGEKESTTCFRLNEERIAMHADERTFELGPDGAKLTSDECITLSIDGGPSIRLTKSGVVIDAGDNGSIELKAGGHTLAIDRERHGFE